MLKTPVRLLLAGLLVAAAWLLVSCSRETAVPVVPDETASVLPGGEKATIIADFIVHGDTHSGYDERNPDVPVVHPALVAEFTARNPDYIFHLGDVIDILSYTEDPEAQPYAEAYRPVWGSLIDAIPTYAALGNHDDEAQFLACFPNVPGRRYFVTDPLASCLFIVLDVPACADDTDLGVQEDFLRATLADQAHKDLRHRFVFFHVPPYTLGFRGDCEPAALWNDMLVEYGVDVVFSGHTHGYEHFMGPCIDEPVLPPELGKSKTVPATHPVHYVVTGRSGAYEQYPIESPTCGECDNCLMSVFGHNYVQVYIGALGKIHVYARDPYGTVLEYFQIAD